MQNSNVNAIMRIIFRVTLVVAIAGCDGKQKAERAAKLSAAQTRLYAYHDFKTLYQHIYSGSLEWFYMQAASSSKADLREAIDIEFPKAKVFWSTQGGDEMKAILIETDTLVAAIQEVMGSLISFEDYEDDVRVARTRDKEERVFSLYRGLDAKFALLLAREESNFKLLVAGDDVETKAVARDVEQFSCINRASEFNWELYTGAINWVYRPQDEASKKRLEKNVSTGLSDLLKTLEQCAGAGVKKREVDSLVADIEYLAVMSSGPMKMLNTKDGYDDPLTILLAEDAIESNVWPAYRSVQIDLKRLHTQIAKKGEARKGDSEPSTNDDADDMNSKLEELTERVRELEERVKTLEEKNK